MRDDGGSTARLGCLDIVAAIGVPMAPAGVCMAFYGGTSRITSRLDLVSGQGSGSSQTRLQSLPRCSERLSQAMPCRNTLTVRPGLSGLLR